MAHIDPRLNRHLQDANSDMMIDAIVIIVERYQDLLETQGDNRFAEQIIQQIMEQIKDQPSFIRFIPRANAVALTAHPRFIKALLNCPCVRVASSATIDPFHF